MADDKRIQFSGQLQLTETSAPPDTPAATAPEPPRIAGVLVDDRNGAPVAGLTVEIFDRRSYDKDTGMRIGSAISDGAGRFVIVPEADVDPSGELLVTVLGSDGSTLLNATVTPPPNTEFVLRVPMTPVEITGEMWVDVAARLEDARVGRIDEVIRDLSLPTGIFADWPMERRQAARTELERAFLDPNSTLRSLGVNLPSLSDLQDEDVRRTYAGQLGEQMDRDDVKAAFGQMTARAISFQDLAEVDWPFALDDLRQGNVGGALNRFADHFHVGEDLDIHLFPRHTSALIRYRDYLRAIWTTTAANVVVVQPNQLTEAQALQQLEGRFHQSFRTVDDVDRPANEVLIGIVTEILVAATGSGFGFGVPAASIPARGTRTAREYLDLLIPLSGISATEMGLRYRLDLARPDSVMSSPVWENIHTIQGFFRDSFQSDAEPDHVLPDVHNQPIIPERIRGNAPFFLHYDEWLRQQAPFWGENFLDVRSILATSFTQESREALKNMVAGTVPGQKGNQLQWIFISHSLEMADALAQGNAHYYNGEYPLAAAAYKRANDLAVSASQDKAFNGLDITALLNQRKAPPITNMKELLAFVSPSPLGSVGAGYGDTNPSWTRDRMALRLVIFGLYVIPICRGDAALALGDYERAVFFYGQATRFIVGIARESDSGGYKPFYLDKFLMYTRGDKPFTVDLRENRTFSPYPLEGQRDEYYDTTLQNPLESLASKTGTKRAHAVEIRLFKLRQGNAMLEWADSLYKVNDASSIARARELYKGVLWLWGEAPPIRPRWPQDPLLFFDLPGFIKAEENPAILSQKNRARLGFYKIEAGLNYFGETDDIVPVMRYRPLKESADRMASLAKAAQQDFLHSTEKVESALVERMRLTTLRQKAELQTAIAGEQIEIAKFDVQVAKDQVTVVKDAIAAKQAEIAKADSFFSQLGDFIGGMKSSITSLPDDTKSATMAGFTSELTGKEMVGQGMLGLGAGASILTGFGIFAVAGYMSMSSMADAANKRMGELATLRDKALPAAERAVVAREHAVRIADFQKQIARADLDLANNLIAFEQDKLLNLAFWANLAQVARRLMRRYLDLGARVAWLAERALAYEQDRSIRLVRMDYHMERLQGVTGGDLLQLDLAELEATRIEGIKRTVPVKRTVSLAREYPLQFGQLKTGGRCVFRTLESDFRRAYPGTAGYRVRAVSVTVSQVDFSNPLRGTLLNQGISMSHPGEQDAHVLVRPSEALPLSEFQLRNDMAVYSLPDETLLPFEGSGVETFWELNFPVAANFMSIESIADVLITFDLRAEYSPERYTKDMLAMPTSIRRWVLMSAAVFDPASLAGLTGAAPSVTFDFDLAQLRLTSHESNRQLKNIAVFLADADGPDVSATFEATAPAGAIPIQMKKGVAMSTLQPDPTLPALPASPLDVLADAQADQRYQLTISKAANPGVAFGNVRDVVLAVEYEAKIA